MRQFTTDHTVYNFDELTEEAKQKALETLSDINVDYEWWESTYEDAKNINLDITSFNTYHRDITGRLTDDLATVCNAIVDNHGDTCDTHILAVDYLKQWGVLVAKYSDGVKLDQVDDDKTDDFDVEADDLTEAFQQELLEEYLGILDKEYDYLTTEEAIIETINANEYEFYEDGRLA